METHETKSDWNELRGRIKSHFTKLNDETVESVKGNLELLSSTLQSAYGYAKEHAEKEMARFKATLHVATKPTVDPIP